MADESTPAGALRFVVECVRSGRCACGALVLFDPEPLEGEVMHAHPTCARFESAMRAADDAVERLPDRYVVIQPPGGQA